MKSRFATALALSLVLVLPARVAGATVTFVGAGDIAECGGTTDTATGNLVRSIPGEVFTLGDNVYPDGTAAQFSQCYDPAWGSFKARTHPSPGNHDYHTAGASGYFGYFGVQPYYAFTLGDWRAYSLNAEISLTNEVTWLKNDLAANPTACIVAYWHEPLFSSGQHGGDSSVKPLWDALYAAGAELILNGHDHDYERFAPQSPAGALDNTTGIREIVAGIGGAGERAFGGAKANSQVRITNVFGVLALTLTATGYSGEFLGTDGNVHDSFSGNCHGAPSGGGGGGGTGSFTVSAAVSNGDVNLSWSSVSGATQYRVKRAVGSGSFVTLAKITATSYTDTNANAGTTYRYRIVAVTSSTTVRSNTITVTP